MSSKVKLSSQTAPKFPRQCVCCLKSASVTKQITTSHQAMSSTPLSLQVPISGIPYCAEHAADYEAWLAWDRERAAAEAGWLKEQATPKSFGPFRLHRLALMKYVWGSAVVLGVFGAVSAGIVGNDPILGAALGMTAGIVIGLGMFFQEQRQQKREYLLDTIPPKPPAPRSIPGVKIVHYLPMGLGVGANVESFTKEPPRLGYQVVHRTYYVKDLIFYFDNPAYAKLFAAENGVKGEA